ncbi:MAG: CAP domain-containing protein [Bacteroidales bacterium]|jgi:uncharacterized protein YkwD|nr:CAP domain-containing protein [Bacteroidales bacterium]NPV36547.1 CAP domain-containing protein [Bacteroidales bacterium]
MKKANGILLVLMLLSFTGIMGQSLYEELIRRGWDKSTLEMANTAKQTKYLSNEEKEVILFINLVRLKPSTFLKIHIHNTEEQYDNDYYYQSLVETLEKMQPVSALLPDSMLTRIARNYAISSGEKGFVGHGDFSQRMKKIKCIGIRAENISYGIQSPEWIVIDLLVDNNVPSLGHRKNILDLDLRYIGVGIAPHNGYDYNCVIDFSSCMDSITPR